MAQPAPTPIVPLAPAPGSPTGAADPFAVQRAQQNTKTSQQLQQLSARVGQLQAYLSPEDLATLQQAVLKAAQTGALDPAALIRALGHAEAREKHASQPFMDTLDAAADIFTQKQAQITAVNDATAADAANRGSFDPAHLQRLQAMSNDEQAFSAAIKNAVERVAADPAGALAQLQALVVKR